MQIEKFVTALVQSIDNNDLLSVLTDAQKQAIVAEFFAKAEKDEILGMMTDDQKSEFETTKNVDLSTVPDNIVFDYVSEYHFDDFLLYCDSHSIVEFVAEKSPMQALCAMESSTVVEYVADALKEEILDYLGEDESVDLSKVDEDEIVQYVADNVGTHYILDYLDENEIIEYVGDNMKNKILDYIGITDHVDSLRDLLDKIE